MLIVYLSHTGNLKRFISKLNNPRTLELTELNAFDKIEEDYILLVPTYDKEMTELFNDFLDVNVAHCKGIIGSGNYNFGTELFCFTANDLSRDYNLPLLRKIELSGDSDDVDYVNGLI